MKLITLLDSVLASTQADAVFAVYDDGDCPVFSHKIGGLRWQAGVDERVRIAAWSFIKPTLGANLLSDRVPPWHRHIASGDDPRARRCSPASHQRCQSSWAWGPRPLTYWRWSRDSLACRERAGRPSVGSARTDRRQILRVHHGVLDAPTHETNARPTASSWPVGESGFIHRAPRRLVPPCGVANPFASAGPTVLRCISFSNC